MKWDDLFILKCSRIINEHQAESLEHFTAFINFIQKTSKNTLPPPHHLVITWTCKLFETSQRLEEQDVLLVLGLCSSTHRVSQHLLFFRTIKDILS